MQEFLIEKNDAGQRLDKYLFKLLPGAEHSLLFKQMRNKNIVLNGKKCKGNEMLSLGDCVKVFMADETITKFRGSENTIRTVTASKDFLSVIYEDEDILVADKPCGILTQKAEPNDLSMNEYLLAYLEGKGYEAGNTFRPSFCNRLDRNTSGLLLGAKSLTGAQYLSEILKNRSLEKYYYAVVCGKVNQNVSLKGYLIKDEKTNTVTVSDHEVFGGVAIETEYRVLEVNASLNLSLLEVHLITGKTHQIRAHLASIGHPILGDMKYGSKKRNQEFHLKYQLLHAHHVIFPESNGNFSYLNKKILISKVPSAFHNFFEF